MTVSIRRLEFTDADLEAYVHLNNRIDTDSVSTIEEVRHWMAAAPAKARWQYWVALQEKRVVGNASNAKDFWTERPGCYRINVNVDPDVRCQGVGTQLYDHCLAQMTRLHDDINFLYASTREHFQDSIRFLEKRGFKLKMREALSQLQVAEFDPAPFWPKAAQSRSLGYEIRTLADLQTENPNWAQRYYQLDIEAMVDVPSPEPYVPPPFEYFEKSHLNEPDFQPASIWIAVKDGEWLGVTSLWVGKGDPAKGHTGLTAVLRPARRQGVATALKLQALTHAQEDGLTVVQTDNEENNPMFHINLALGFKAIPASLYYRKDCRVPSQNSFREN